MFRHLKKVGIKGNKGIYESGKRMVCNIIDMMVVVHNN
jgi:hypothetical protein